jgi:hypothetical protein
MLYKTLLMVVLPVVSLLADENVSVDAPHCQEGSSEISPTFIQIVKEQSDSIQHFDKGRIYLKAERIFPTSRGLVLYNGQSSILLPSVFADGTGCYLHFRLCGRDDELKCSNSNCRWRWFFREWWTLNCPRCGETGNWVNNN